MNYKFRAYDPQSAEFSYSHIDDDFSVWGFENGELKAWAIVEHSGDLHTPPYPTTVELEKPEMWTGLLDKNGKEIYSGDILRFTHMRSAEPFLVEWNSEDAEFTKYYPRDKVEVIGNIWEHPDLMEQKE